MPRALFILLAASSVFGQSFGTYANGVNNQPVARVSFLRSQWPTNQNPLADPTLIAWFLGYEQVKATYSSTNGVSFRDYSLNGYDATFTGGGGNHATNGVNPGQTLPWVPYFAKTQKDALQTGTNVTVPSTFTVSAWVSPNAPGGGYDRIVENTYANGFYLGTDSANPSTKFVFLIANISGNGCTSTTAFTSGAWSATATVNPWYLVTGTYDGTSEKIYVNGSLQNTCTQSATTTSGSLANSTKTAGSFVVGDNYSIVSVGTTSFTSIGASANTVGTLFTATGVGTGTGTAYPMYSPAPMPIAIGGCSSIDSASCGGSSPYGGWFDGQIQDVRVYNRVLPVAEILAIYNAENAPH